MKKSKHAYYDKYFEINWHNIKNIWEGIKSFISLKPVASRVPAVLSLDNGDFIGNPFDIAKYSQKHFSDYLAKESDSTMFLQPTDKEEMLTSYPLHNLQNIIFLKNDISKQLADLFNFSSMTGVFLSVLKTAKVVPVFKKDSNLDYMN